MPMDAAEIIRRYYGAFNRQDDAAMLALLADDVLHEPSQGSPRKGKALFGEFLSHMHGCYRERVIDPVIMATPDGVRASAEFALEGTYIASDDGLPAARGQTYSLRVGAFFELADGLILRVSNHYNLGDWIRQVENG